MLVVWEMGFLRTQKVAPPRSVPRTARAQRRRMQVRRNRSQMPRHLISDAHEWMNEIPTVPTCYLAKPQPRERAWQNQRMLSLTLVWHCEET